MACRMTHQAITWTNINLCHSFCSGLNMLIKCLYNLHPSMSARLVTWRWNPPGMWAGCVRNCIGTNLLCCRSFCMETGRSGSHWLGLWPTASVSLGLANFSKWRRKPGLKAEDIRSENRRQEVWKKRGLKTDITSTSIQLRTGVNNYIHINRLWFTWISMEVRTLISNYLP